VLLRAATRGVIPMLDAAKREERDARGFFCFVLFCGIVFCQQRIRATRVCVA